MGTFPTKAQKESIYGAPRCYDLPEDYYRASWLTNRIVILRGHSKIPHTKQTAAQLAAELFDSEFDHERNDTELTPKLADLILLRAYCPYMSHFKLGNDYVPVELIEDGKLGIGIKCGEESSLLQNEMRVYVLDADDEASADFLREHFFNGDNHTFEVTTRRGCHFYVLSKLELPSKKISRIGSTDVNIDFRGLGSYVVAPGAFVDGHRYRACHRDRRHYLYELTDKDLELFGLKNNSAPSRKPANTLDTSWVAFADSVIAYLSDKIKEQRITIGDESYIPISTRGQLTKTAEQLIHEYDLGKEKKSRSERAAQIIFAGMFMGMPVEEIAVAILANQQIAMHYLAPGKQNWNRKRRVDIVKLRRMVRNILRDISRCASGFADMTIRMARRGDTRCLARILTSVVAPHLSMTLKNDGDRYAHLRSAPQMLLYAIMNQACSGKSLRPVVLNRSKLARSAGIDRKSVRKALSALLEFIELGETEIDGKIRTTIKLKLDKLEAKALSIYGSHQNIINHFSRTFPEYYLLFASNYALRPNKQAVNAPLHTVRNLSFMAGSDTVEKLESPEDYAKEQAMNPKTVSRRIARYKELAKAFAGKRQLTTDTARAALLDMHRKALIPASHKTLELIQSNIAYALFAYHERKIEEEKLQKIFSWYLKQTVPKERFDWIAL